MAKKRKHKTATRALTTSDEILDLWMKTSKKALGTKRFANDVVEKFAPKLKRAIDHRLKNHKFTARDRRNTVLVATDLGIICKLMTLGREVDEDTFEKVFELVKDGPKCPAGGGGGEWCAI